MKNALKPKTKIGRVISERFADRLGLCYLLGYPTREEAFASAHGKTVEFAGFKLNEFWIVKVKDERDKRHFHWHAVTTEAEHLKAVVRATAAWKKRQDAQPKRLEIQYHG